MTPTLSYPQHLRATMTLGLPLIGGHLAQFAIGLTDTVMLGWYSVDALAALVLGSSLFFVLFIMGSGFAWAVMPLVASAYGQNDDLGIRRVTRMGLWVSLLFALFCMPVFWWSARILELLGQSPQLATDAQIYLRIAGWAVIPQLFIMVMKSYLAALERTRAVLWITLLAAAVNVVANYALVFGNLGAPEMGIAGAATASLLISLVALVATIWYSAAVLPEHDLFRRLWRPDWDVLARVVRLGIPIAFTNLAEVALFAATSIMMGWLGTVTLAAHGIALQLTTACFMVHVGLSNAATVRAGNAFGRGDRGNLLRGAVTVIALSTAMAVVTITVFLTLPAPLIALFIDPAEPDRVAIMTAGVTLLAMAALFQFVDGAQVVALGLLRGMQDTSVPMIYASLSYWVIGLPSSYIFGFTMGYGGVGVWAGLVIGLALAAVLMMGRFWTVTLPRMTLH